MTAAFAGSAGNRPKSTATTAVIAKLREYRTDSLLPPRIAKVGLFLARQTTTFFKTSGPARLPFSVARNAGLPDRRPQDATTERSRSITTNRQLWEHCCHPWREARPSSLSLLVRSGRCL